MWANINHLVRNIPKLRLFVVALLSVSLLFSFAQPVFAADLTGTWAKTDQGLTAVRVGTSLYFNPTKEGAGQAISWYMQENAAGVKCQSKIYFTANPLEDANAAKTATQRFYKEVAEGAGTTGCVEKTGDRNNVTISGTPGSATTDPGNGDGTGAGATATKVCDVGGLSFAICPLINFMAAATNQVSSILQGLLYIQPLSLDTSSSTNFIFKAWASILTVANLVLAIAFLFVIFSQATSMALSSYGIKKMLPRIIVAAILMNLSYYICALAVDLSNLAGVGIAGFLSAATTGQWNGEAFRPDSINNSIGNSKFMEVLGGIGVGAIIVFFFLVPVLIAALAVLFTLAARLAIVVLLVMVAPLAFAAWILPNTEKYFKKWYELFVSMLAIFPMVMGLFAAAAIASKAITASTITAPDVEGVSQETVQSVLLPLIALLVQAMPLFALPFLFKAAGGVLGQLHAVSTRYSQKGLNNKVGQGLQNRVRRYGKFGALAGVGAAGKLAGSGNPNSRLSRAGRRISRGYTNIKAFDKAVETAETARKSGKEQRVAERAAHIGDSDKLAGKALSSFGGERYNEIVRSQVAADFKKRVDTLSGALRREGMPVYDKDANGNDIAHTGLTGRLEQAYAARDGASATALISHMAVAGGANGRKAVESVITNNAALGKEFQNDINNAIYDNAYSSFIGKRGSVAKGGFGNAAKGQDPTRWYSKIEGVPTGSLASSDDMTLRDHYDKIEQSEARAIVSNQALWSTTANDKSRELLQRKVLGLPASGNDPVTNRGFPDNPPTPTNPPAGPPGPQGPSGSNGGGNNGGNGGGNAGGGTTIFNGGFPTGGGSAPAGGGATAAPAGNAAPQSAAPPQNLGNQTFTGSAPAAQPPIVQQQVNVQQQAPQFTAAYSPGSLRASSPATINNIISNAGGAQNLSEGDITRITEAAQDRPELANIHDEMLRERRRRINEPDRSESGAIIMPPSPGGFQGETNINHDNRQ